MLGILFLVLVVLVFGAFKLTTGLLRIALLAFLILASFALVGWGMTMGMAHATEMVGAFAANYPVVPLAVGVVLTAIGVMCIDAVPGMVGLAAGLVLIAFAATSLK